MSQPVKVDIWSDIACPFCYIGKRAFETAVAESDVPVEVVYHSFELVPETPEDSDETHAEHIASTMGTSLEEALHLEERVAASAAEAGLTIDYARLRQTKTVKSHQLLHLAKAHGLQIELKERLMTAYFSEGRHLGHDDELIDLAGQVGLDADEVARVLADGTHLDDVRADQQRAAELGITGVPFFVLDDQFAVSGAHDVSVFTDALQRAYAEQDATV